jgi:signal transduction histidine kinase
VVPSERNLTHALYVAAVALGRTRDAQEAARVATEEIQRASGIEAVALYLLDSTGDLLVLREYAGTTSAFRDQVARLPLAQARVAMEAIREERVVCLPVSEHPDPTLRALYAGQGFRHLAVIPVAGREEILGVLHLAGRDEPPVGSEELALVQAIGGLVGVALENARLSERMLIQQERLRALAEATLKAREDEARRIAHELHDEAGQLLASIHIALDQLTERLPDQAAVLRSIHEQLDRVEQQLRRLARELRPTILDDLGLGPAVEWLAQGVTERTGLTIQVQAGIGRLDPAVETALYRIVQESLNNVVRHASASRVEIDLQQTPEGVIATIRDNGRGLNVETTLQQRGARGLGLIGMRERAEALGGRLEVRSAPGEGAEVRAIIPGGPR